MTRDEIVRDKLIAQMRVVEDQLESDGHRTQAAVITEAISVLQADGSPGGETYSPDATASIVRGLAQSGSIDRGSFSAYADQSLQGHDTTTHRADEQTVDEDDESFEIGEPDEITVAIVPRGAIDQARAAAGGDDMTRDEMVADLRNLAWGAGHEFCYTLLAAADMLQADDNRDMPDGLLVGTSALAYERGRADERVRIRKALLGYCDHPSNLDLDDSRAVRRGLPPTRGAVAWADIERVLLGGD